MLVLIFIIREFVFLQLDKLLKIDEFVVNVDGLLSEAETLDRLAIVASILC